MDTPNPLHLGKKVAMLALWLMPLFAIFGLASYAYRSRHSMRIRWRTATLAVAFALWPISISFGLPLDPTAYTSLGTLSTSSGTLTFDTDALTITGASGLASTTGVTQTQVSGPTIAVFDFNGISIGGAVTIQVTGSRPLAILSRGNATIGAPITISGGNGSAGSAGVNGNNGLPGIFGNNDANAGGFGALAIAFCHGLVNVDASAKCQKPTRRPMPLRRFQLP